MGLHSVVVVMFCLHEQAWWVCRFNSPWCNIFFHHLLSLSALDIIFSPSIVSNHVLNFFLFQLLHCFRSCVCAHDDFSFGSTGPTAPVPEPGSDLNRTRTPGPGPGSLSCLDRTSRSGPGSGLRVPNPNRTGPRPVYD